MTTDISGCAMHILHCGALSNNFLINLGDYNVAGVDSNKSNTDLETLLNDLEN